MFRIIAFTIVSIFLLYMGSIGFLSFSFKRNQAFLFLLSLSVGFFVLSLILYPEDCYRASVDGVNTWINIVLPALLPFFVGAELLIGLGIIDFFGTMLEPLMRPVFKVPGVSSFVFLMSITSGYPVGVKLTCSLRQQGMCTRTEAQRMLAFCSTSGPLFMIGAVSVGMLGSPIAGSIIAISHYISAVILGIVSGFLIKDPASTRHEPLRWPSVKRGLRAMYDKRRSDGRPIGILLGDSVKESINTLLIVGGFIILFSVVIRICTLSGILQFISAPMIGLADLVSLPRSIVTPLLSGMLEITIGSRQISSLATVPFSYKVIAVSFIIGWSGFSIHAQAVSFIGKTDLSASLYMASKMLHGIFAAVITPILSMMMLPDKPQQAFLPYADYNLPPTFFRILMFSTKILLFIILFMLVSILIGRLANRMLGFKTKRS